MVIFIRIVGTNNTATKVFHLEAPAQSKILAGFPLRVGIGHSGSAEMKSFDEEVLDYEDGQSMFEGMLEVVECPEQVQKQRIIEESITMIPSCYLLP